jgi:hypothetical protein
MPVGTRELSTRFDASWGMSMFRVLLPCALLVLLSTPAVGQPATIPAAGALQISYSRPDANASQRDEAQRQCELFADQMVPPAESTWAQGLIIAIGREIFERAVPRAKLEYIDDCMIARGYNRFHVTRASAQYAQPNDDGADQLEAGDLTRPQLARAYVNENWLPLQRDTEFNAIQLADHAPLTSAPSGFGGLIGSGEPPRRIRLSSDADAVLLASINAPARGTFVVMLMAVSEDGRPSTHLGRRAHMFLRSSDEQITTRAFVVPPGRYVIEGVTYSRGVGLNSGQRIFCLRTAALTVAAGDITDLGHFQLEEPQARQADQFGGQRSGDFWSPRLRLDAPDPEARRATLAEVTWASRLRSGQWRSGAHFPCTATPSFLPDIGAFDIPNFSAP